MQNQDYKLNYNNKQPNVNEQKKNKETRDAALMGALMTADGAWSDPRISIHPLSASLKRDLLKRVLCAGVARSN